jgi:dTDP-4-dehydrorhamnose reductase
MKALVVGASGQLGAALVALLGSRGIPVTGTHCSQPRPGSMHLDIRDHDEVRRRLPALAPDLVFLAQNTPGGVDFCEAHPEQAAAVIVEGTRHILEAAAQRSSKVVFFSSDYVFDGKSGPYGEEAAACPVSVYGRAKLEAEELVRAYCHEALIVRTTAVFSWAPGTKNFAMQVHERLSSGMTLRVPNDQWCNPTLADYLSEACLQLAQSDQRGTFNIVGRDWMPRSEFAVALARAMSLDPALIQAVPTAELGQGARRPLRGGLKTDKLCQALGAAPWDLSRALEFFTNRFHRNPPVTAPEKPHA